MFLRILTGLLAACTCVQARTFDPSVLAQAQGTYRFEDGTCVTGGRMDEDGIRLLYMDVWRNRMALLALFDNGKLHMLVPPDTRLALDDSGDTITLTDTEGHTRTATRMHHPEARAIRFRSGTLELAGTLYSPTTPGQHPAIVLVHGSGPADRFGGTWITYFTDLGFAVLAYDKRGTGESQGDWRKATYPDLAADLSAAVDWLANQPGIDPRRVGIHSTSQSGWYAPYAAAHDPRVRFLIQRVGPALWTGPVTRHENENDWRADGIAEADITAASALWLRLNQLARDGGTRRQAQALIDKAADQPWFSTAYGEGWRTVEADSWRRRQANASLDPAGIAGYLNIPVLWFLAEQDENVPYAGSLQALTQAKAEHHADITIVTVRNAPHSFLIKQPDGSVRYTDQYWPEMAAWLKAKGIIDDTFKDCAPRAEPSGQTRR